MVQINDITPVEDDAARVGEQLRVEGNKAFTNGDFTAAALSYQQSLQAAPPPAASAYAALGNRSKTLLKLGCIREAIADAEMCVQVTPSGHPYAAKARFRKGEALEALGDLKAAREAYREANKEAPTDTAVLKKLKSTSEALASVNGETFDTTVETVEKPKAESSSPQPPPPKKSLWNEGNEHLRCGRYEAALLAYDEYAKQVMTSERHAKLLGNKALALSKLGKHDDATAAARASIKKDKTTKLLFRVGNVCIDAAEVVVDALEHKSKEPKTSQNKPPISKKIESLRKRADSLASEAKSAFQAGFATQTKPEDAEVFVHGVERCDAFLETLEGYVFVERERMGVTEKEIGLTCAATVSVSSLSVYARRMIAETEKKTSYTKTPEKNHQAVSESDRKIDDDVCTFRASMQKFGCAVVRLPDVLFTDVDIFADATKACVDFFASPAEQKSGFRPLSKKIPHGYIRAGEEFTPRGGLLTEDSHIMPDCDSVPRRDEMFLERFSVCEWFDDTFDWPTSEMKESAQNSHATLTKVAKICGDTLLLGRPEKYVVDDMNVYEGILEDISKSKHAQRTTFALQKKGRKSDEVDETKIETEEEKATRSLKDSLENVVTSGSSEPEPTLLTLVPRVMEASTDENKTRTATVRVRCDGTETVFSTQAPEKEKSENISLGGNLERDVLVVAGARLRDVMGAAYLTATTSFEAAAGDGACVRVVHRA